MFKRGAQVLLCGHDWPLDDIEPRAPPGIRAEKVPLPTQHSTNWKHLATSYP